MCRSDNAVVRYCAVQYGTVRYDTVAYSTVRYGAVPNIAYNSGHIEEYVGLVNVVNE
jgi:hypothetical protein